MSDECPDCGNPLTYYQGIAECDCGYTHVLSPCVCCFFDICIGKDQCGVYQKWAKLYGGKQ